MLFITLLEKILFLSVLYYFQKVLDEERYEYVLDRACLQFEPDDPDFVRVSFCC